MICVILFLRVPPKEFAGLSGKYMGGLVGHSIPDYSIQIR